MYIRIHMYMYMCVYIYRLSIRIKSKKSCLRRMMFHRFCLWHIFFLQKILPMAHFVSWKILFVWHVFLVSKVLFSPVAGTDDHLLTTVSNDFVRRPWLPTAHAPCGKNTIGRIVHVGASLVDSNQNSLMKSAFQLIFPLACTDASLLFNWSAHVTRRCSVAVHLLVSTKSHQLRYLTSTVPSPQSVQ